MYLFLIRHTLVHNGGHFDNTFFTEAKKHIKLLKLEDMHQSGVLSPCSPEILSQYISLTKKLIEDFQA